MATRRQSLPSSRYTPPKAINQSTTNRDVKLFVYNFIRGYDDDLDERAAWEIARKAIGDGEAVLEFKKDEWIELLGDWGDIIYEEIKSQKQTRFGHTLKNFNDYFLSCLHVPPCLNSIRGMNSSTPKVSVSPSSSTQLHLSDGSKTAQSQAFPSTDQQYQIKALGCLHSTEIPIDKEKEGACGSRKRLPFHHDID